MIEYLLIGVLGLSLTGLLVYIWILRDDIANLEMERMFLREENDRIEEQLKQLVPRRKPLTEEELERRRDVVADKLDRLDVL